MDSSPQRIALLTRRARRGDADAILELTNLFESAGKLEDCEEVFRAAVSAGVHDVTLPYADFLAAIPGREAEAETVLRSANEVGVAGGHQALAGLLNAMGRLSEAEGEFRLAVDAGDVLARVNYGQYLFDQGRANEAEEQLLLSIPSVESACVRLGNLYEDLGLNERAGQQFALALAEGTDAHFEYAELLARTHRLVEAEAEYRLAVDAGELAREAHLFLGEMLLKQDRIREAKEHFRLALALDEQRSATALAELLQAEGRRGEAEEHYLQALAMGDDDAHSGYGQLLLQLGRYEEAVGHLRAAAGLSHDSNELLRLGYALAKAGHGQQASRVYREYRKVKRSSR